MEAEQYGAVKIRLFQAFEEIENMLENGRLLYIDSPQLEELLRRLGIT